MTWDFLHRWYMPFVYMTLAPLVAVPVAVYFQNGMSPHAGGEFGLAYGSSWVLRDDFLATIVVYLLNLGTGIWLFNGDGSTRWAALWATLLGLGRIVLPITLASMSDVAVAGNQHYIDWHTLRILVWFQDFQMFVLGIMLWGAFARFVGETGGEAARSAYASA